jgi:hypothetical protein
MGNGDCTSANAVCEPTGYCSFPDTACASGRRYGELGGPFAELCVIEAAVDAAIDTPAACAGYVMLPGITTSYYKVITTAGTWMVQRDACAADGANSYLAVPADMAELMALVTASGAMRFWVGIDDIAAETVHRTASGQGFSGTSPLWDVGEPDNNPIGMPGEGDCVSAEMSTVQLRDELCTRPYPAVCECQP